LEPLSPSHLASLQAASLAPGAEDRYRYLNTPPQTPAQIAAWLDVVSASQDPLFFAVIDPNTDNCEGRQSLMRIEPTHGVIEIGHILWGPAIARTRVATEAFYLAAEYVFDHLGYRRFEWKCDALNQPSRAAALRFGFTFEGIFRQHLIVKGQNRDTAWHSIIDQDWPALRAAFQAWLNPANFDSDGQQLTRLRDFRS
jgi:RimJ/RimL family protein N-acetyltransferase